MTRWTLFFLSIAACIACDRPAEPSAGVLTPPSPPDLAPPEGVTQRFVERVRSISPGATIERQDERHLRIDGRELDLANMGGECRRVPAECDAVIDRWARVAAGPEDDAPATRAQVRAVLFPSDSIDQQRARARAAGQPDPFTTRPFLGPLVEALVIDHPDTIAYLGQATRAELGDPTDDELHALALENMRAAFATALPSEPFGPAPNVRIVSIGDSYENSRVLLHERWADVARSVSGDLLVAVPARDVVIYTGSASEGDVATLRWLALLAVTREPHPLAPTILRWTPDRWELFHANDQPDPAIEATMRAAHAAP